MSMAVGKKGGAMADINVTPMIDVLLVLLIIFMVITPLTPHGLDTLVPQPPPPNQPPPPPNQDPTVVVEVKKDQSIEINGQAVAEKELQSRLEDIFKTRATKVVFVKGDPDLDYRYVAQAIDDAKGAGLDKVGIMTPKVEAGQ
ncbi:MAG: biopolymer transporter ExbD [Acidobacteriaceae bacterium]|nr:biopolymer transporter ExbD [Acidobacteriaceae bacterium]MBV9765593.1 biopolymer transporter ExbD [Acidobacteriaceae bacterium]